MLLSITTALIAITLSLATPLISAFLDSNYKRLNSYQLFQKLSFFSKKENMLRNALRIGSLLEEVKKRNISIPENIADSLQNYFQKKDLN